MRIENRGQALLVFLAAVRAVADIRARAFASMDAE